MRERRRAQLIQCRDGTQDQRNINAILELAAGVDNEAAKKVGEAAKEGEEGPSPKKRRREVKNAVRGREGGGGGPKPQEEKEGGE